MNPRPMTNDPDRVAPDRRIHLPGRTPVRPRRRNAAGVLSVLLGLFCFTASPAWAYKAGTGADDRPSGIPEYANAAAYLADANRNDNRYVKIGRYTLDRAAVEAFHKANTLTDAKLIASFANVAAYLADSGRTNRLYADIGSSVYLVTELEARNAAGTLSDSSLPNPVDSLIVSIDGRFGTVAVGHSASATAYGATAVGSGAAATANAAIAIGAAARATQRRAIAIGDDAKATHIGAVAIGMDSGAFAWRDIAVGAEAHANDGVVVGGKAKAYGGTSLGLHAKAYGPQATSLGSGSAALGAGATAVGDGAVAASQSMSLNHWIWPCAHGHYAINGWFCGRLLTATEKANANLNADNAAGERFRKGIRERLLGVLNSHSVRHATALGSGSRATSATGTALGASSWATGLHGSTAVGGTSRATGERSTALGGYASAGGSRSTAVGQASEAHGDYTVAVGRRAVAGGLSSDETYPDVAAYLKDTARTGHTNVQIGKKVYRVTTLEAVTSLTEKNLPGTLTATAGGVAVGVSAAAAAVNSIALGREASATGTESIALGRGASATGTKGIAIGSGVSAGANEVVVGASGHTYKLPGLAPSSGTRVVTVDSNGRLSTQSTAAGTAARGAAARGAAVLSSGVTPLNRDLGTPAEAADYEKAPAIGSGPTAPATAEQRRVVVQDTNRDGSVRLRTLDFGDLSGMEQRLAGVDRRVTSLSERLNKATAMSSALSALPNVVPGDNRFFLGVGAGHYSSEQALAIGMSARVQSRVFVNAGVALASGDEVSVRGGVGVVW